MKEVKQKVPPVYARIPPYEMRLKIASTVMLYPRNRPARGGGGCEYGFGTRTRILVADS